MPNIVYHGANHVAAHTDEAQPPEGRTSATYCSICKGWYKPVPMAARVTLPPEHNTFRACDAMEYVDAYRKFAGASSAQPVREALIALHERMDTIAAIGDALPTYLLAAYRGYEDALLFIETGTVPTVVKLDQSQTTHGKCEEPDGNQA